MPPAVTVATDVGLLLHNPPVVASCSTVIAPAHTFIVPVIVAGRVFTVTIALLLQPVGSVYVIVAVPGFIPLTVPVKFTVAIPVFPLLHVPPVVRSLNKVVAPGHMLKPPVMTAGSGLTVTVTLVLHPVTADVNVIADVPLATPLTIPLAEPIVATAVLPLLHVPLPSVSVVVPPAHRVVMPLIVGGGAFTVTVVVTLQLAPSE